MRKGVPVVVDAAAQIRPKDGLRSDIAARADLVAVSGGKALGNRTLPASCAVDVT
jgi:D-glucosaminate-6-phosphate ammonia-lyase